MSYKNQHKDDIFKSINDLIKNSEERILTSIKNFTLDIKESYKLNDVYFETINKLYGHGGITSISFLQLYSSQLREKRLLSRSILLSQIVYYHPAELFLNSLIGLSNKTPNINLRDLIEINMLDLTIRSLIETENFFVDYLYQDSDKSLYDDFLKVFINQVLIKHEITTVEWLNRFIDVKIKLDEFSDRIRFEPDGLAAAVFNKHIYECLKIAFESLEKNTLLPALNYLPMIEVVFNKNNTGRLQVNISSKGAMDGYDGKENFNLDSIKHDLNIINEDRDKIVRYRLDRRLITNLFYDGDLFSHDFNMNNPQIDDESK